MTKIRKFIRKLYSFYVECIWGPIFTLVFMVFYLIFYFIRECLEQSLNGCV